MGLSELMNSSSSLTGHPFGLVQDGRAALLFGQGGERDWSLIRVVPIQPGDRRGDRLRSQSCPNQRVVEVAQVKASCVEHFGVERGIDYPAGGLGVRYFTDGALPANNKGRPQKGSLVV